MESDILSVVWGGLKVCGGICLVLKMIVYRTKEMEGQGILSLM